MDRNGLLQREAHAWDALEAAVARVPGDRRAVEGVVPGWSVQDLVWHCAKWAEYTAGNLEAMAAGTWEEEHHDDAYWDAMNADIAAASKALTWDEVTGAEMRQRARRSRRSPGRQPVRTSGETFEHYEEHTAVAAFADGT
jgi:hypothetical protein